MPARQRVPMLPDTNSRQCPICGSAVRIQRKSYGYGNLEAEQLIPVEVEYRDNVLAPQDPEIAAKLREDRRGKKTVALVGMSPTSCSLAPYDDENCDIWALNEMHAFSFLKRATAWFQLHPRYSFQQPVAKRMVKNHYEWLTQEHDFPIYMQFVHSDIPSSVEYPLQEVSERFFGKVWHGEKHRKYFTSTLAYMHALALYQGYERIEIYGNDMSGTDEYLPQKTCYEFWLGVGVGMGVELYVPEDCQLLWGPLYGYQGVTNQRQVVVTV